MRYLAYLYKRGKLVHDMMRAREIGKSHVTLTGAIRSVKDKLWKQFESPLERDFLIILDFDWNVEEFHDQPVTISYTDKAGKSRNYTPDILVFYRKDIAPARWMKPLLAEIKTKQDIEKNRGKYAERFKAAEEYAQSRGWEFQVLTEDNIRTPYLKNAYFLRGFRNHPILPADVELLTETLELLDESDPETLINTAARIREEDPMMLEPIKASDYEARAQLISSMWRMVVDHSIETDLTRPLTMSSRLWLPDPDVSIPFKLPCAASVSRLPHSTQNRVSLTSGE